MSKHSALAIFCLMLLTPVLALAQAPDPAAERARLANQRIQAEAEQRAREEQERQARAATQSAAPGASPPPPPAAELPAGLAPSTQAVPQLTGTSTAAPPPTRPSAPSGDYPTSRALEQLRELGELRDAGYVTEAEFQRIKSRILEQRF